MDISQAVTGYITKIMSVGDNTSTSQGAKMKVLLLDRDTVAIVSTATTQSALLNHEIYLTDRLDNSNRERLRHLRCICFIRPSSDSIQLLIDELREPKYAEYYICKRFATHLASQLILDNGIDFSNVVLKSSLERLAEADQHEVVKSVGEYFADYLVINRDFMSLDLIPPLHKVWGSGPELWQLDSLQRSTEAVIAVLFSLKKKPLIRYARNSLLAKKLATEVRYRMTQEEQLFDFRKPDTSPILLIVDRRDDPVTPLLTQWTYQAMVHEIFGIKNGRVDLNDVPDIRPELKEIVLQYDTDPFFAKNMYLNFGDLGQNAKEYVEQYASKRQGNKEMNTVADMKRFIEEYPEFRKLSSNVTKHITLVGELSRRVANENLLDVSELEQSLACNDNHTQDVKTIQKLLADPSVPDLYKLRLVSIYALRYSKSPSSSLPILSDLLRSQTSLSPHNLSFISSLLTYHASLLPSVSAANAGPPLFQQSTNFFADARSRLARGLKGVENVYTQHSPRLESTLQELIKGRLKDTAYPFVEGGGSTRDKPQDVIVFMVGGTTYEEARMVAGINANTPGVRIVLGGTGTVNSEAFMEDVQGAVRGWGLDGDNSAEGRLRATVGR